MDSGKQKEMNKDRIIKIKNKIEQIDETRNRLSHIKWRLENIQPYQNLKILLNTRNSIKRNLQFKNQELKQLQNELIIS